MLKTARRLYDLGWAIHWLHPKSKRPIESGWTTGPRMPWAKLVSKYKKGMNIGVRLGTPSEVNGGYLAVIDCDVKSTKVKHLKEMEKKLYDILGDTKRGTVVVRTGRGNGSRHIYVRTARPLQSRRIGQSGESVRCRIPSAQKPSRKEIGSLSGNELAEGWRIRPAWEISQMGTGSQVVLPPSIHPDTGKQYEWAGNEPTSVSSQLPIYIDEHDKLQGRTSADRNIQDPKEKGKASTFKAEEVDLVGSNLPSDIVDLILQGKDCEDRSAALFTVAMSLTRHGFSENQILSVLTDRETFLGQAAYDHAKTSSRERAAKWVANFTLKKAKDKADGSNDFDVEDDTLEDAEPLSEEEAEAQWIELITPKDWQDLLDRTEGPTSPPKGSIKNILTILSHAVPQPLFIHNEFSNRDFYGMNAPWGAKTGNAITDPDIIQIRLWLSRKFRFEPPRDKVSDAVTALARNNSIHPVRDYFRRLEWDGVPRIDTWLKDYAGGTGPQPYLSAVSRKTIVSMVARVFQPGIQVDHMLILEGAQGIGKSTIPRILAGEEWFCETMGDIKDKDAMLNLIGALIIEISELATLKRADSESYKAFFSKKVDRVRAPYGERWQEHKRQSVFIGTTNSRDYLKDKTGNRRFWPVPIKQLDFKRFKEDRDQLFAEAVWHWDIMGEDLFLKGEEDRQAKIVQASRVAEDEEDKMYDEFVAWLAQQTKEQNTEIDLQKFKLSSLFGDYGPWPKSRGGNWEMQKAANVLRKAKFFNFRSNGQSWWKIVDR